MANDYKVYNSIGGSDIVAVFGNTIFAELQMVAYKVDREVGPIHVMGSPNMVATGRGKRVITGQCVFTVFDRDSLLETMNDNAERNPWITKTELSNFNDKGEYSSTQAKNAALQGGSLSQSGTDARTGLFSGDYAASSLRTKSKAFHADQLLPFDITLVGTSEYDDRLSKMSILGVEIMSEAGGVSIDDLTLEKRFSFIARSVTPWTRVD